MGNDAPRRLRTWTGDGAYSQRPVWLTVRSNIGLSYLPIKLAETGIQLEVELFDERIPALVDPDSLYDPKGERTRS